MDSDDPLLEVTLHPTDGAIVTRYIVVAELINQDGHQELAIETSDELSGWDALGLLRFAEAVNFTELATRQ